MKIFFFFLLLIPCYVSAQEMIVDVEETKMYQFGDRLPSQNNIIIKSLELGSKVRIIENNPGFYYKINDGFHRWLCS